MRSIQLHCGESRRKSEYNYLLRNEGITIDDSSTFSLIIDEPIGWAFSGSYPVQEHCRTVILCMNPCPTYKLDLLQMNPAALISLKDNKKVLHIIDAVFDGESFIPTLKTPLTPVERLTLRLVAYGYTNKDIAKQRDICEGTAKNCIHEIYRKLCLKSRVQAAHYYFGSWHLLLDWVPPVHVS